MKKQLSLMLSLILLNLNLSAMINVQGIAGNKNLIKKDQKIIKIDEKEIIELNNNIILIDEDIEINGELIILGLCKIESKNGNKLLGNGKIYLTENSELILKNISLKIYDPMSNKNGLKIIANKAILNYSSSKKSYDEKLNIKNLWYKI